MKIAICDDDKDLLDILSSKIKNVINKYNVYNFNFDYYCYNDPDELIYDNEYLKFDIVFLDIEMPKTSGLSAGDEIYSINNSAIIFYVTSYDNYLAQSIKHRVYRFIVKGDEKELEDGIRSMLSDLAFNESRYHFIYKDKNHSIKMIKINYFESRHNSVKIVTDNNIYEQRITIKELEQTLPKFFCRCHRSYIVNIKKIEEFETIKAVALYDGTILPVGRKYRSELIKRIVDGDSG